MPLLSTFESPYKKVSTLGRTFAEIEKNYFNDLLNAAYAQSHNLTDAVFTALKTALTSYPDIDATEIYNYLKASYSGSINAPAVDEGIRLFKVALSRKKQAAQAQAQAQEQAAAYAAAMAPQAAPVDPEETEPAQAVEVVEAVELPEGLDAADVIAINEAARAVDLDALSREAQAQAAQAVEAYAEGRATPQQVETAIDTAAAVEHEKTRNALLNVGLPLTLAVGLFIFFFKDKKS
jgi:hypothetical protein